jgi:hypothetical protein
MPGSSPPPYRPRDEPTLQQPAGAQLHATPPHAQAQAPYGQQQLYAQAPYGQQQAQVPLQEWSSGICDCCNTLITPSGQPVGGCCLCCKACCCACMVFGDISTYMSESEGVWCAGEENCSKACCLYYAAGQRVPKVRRAC